jgi:NAD(P)-dependent dehydrogenase (short-subunit alcohol dehydrogenase family)
MTVADKTVLVTGASRGIGRALAAEALARNARSDQGIGAAARTGGGRRAVRNLRRPASR